MPISAVNITQELRQTLRLLIRANHILHKYGLVDAFGHISVRHPSHPNQYIIAAYDPGAPALVSSANDFIEYYVNGSTPVRPPQPQGYSERFIHGEILRVFPEVNCVIHSHSEAVIPFTTAGVQIRPVFHMAGFLGVDGPPTFDIASAYAVIDQASSTPDMLVKSPDLGFALVASFASDEHLFAKPCPVVLQTKHGFTCIGASVQRAVYRAVYLQKNCQLLRDALDLAGNDGARVAYLTKEEAEACKVMNEKTEDKAFRLWLREVQVDPLYVCEEGEPESLAIGGMNPDHVAVPPAAYYSHDTVPVDRV